MTTETDPILSDPRYINARDNYQRACKAFQMEDTAHGRDAASARIEDAQDALAETYAAIRDGRI